MEGKCFSDSFESFVLSNNDVLKFIEKRYKCIQYPRFYKSMDKVMVVAVVNDRFF